MSEVVEECENGYEIKDEKLDRLDKFVSAIEGCERFNIVGLSEDYNDFILRDTTFSEDTEDSCVMLSVEEVKNVPLDSVMGAISGKRNDIVLQSYSRVVGYYSSIHNWNSSKRGELRDRIEGRRNGSYGSKNAYIDTSAINEAIAVTNRMAFA